MVDARGPVLVVEDEADIRQPLVRLLEAEGYPAAGASDAVVALERLRSRLPLPRLIVLDLTLPRMDGVEFLRVLANERAWSGIPVLVLTGDPFAEAAACALGARRCLVKPIPLEELFEVVGALVRGGPEAPALAS